MVGVTYLGGIQRDVGISITKDFDQQLALSVADDRWLENQLSNGDLVHLCLLVLGPGRSRRLIHKTGRFSEGGWKTNHGGKPASVDIFHWGYEADRKYCSLTSYHIDVSRVP